MFTIRRALSERSPQAPAAREIPVFMIFDDDLQAGEEPITDPPIPDRPIPAAGILIVVLAAVLAAVLLVARGVESSQSRISTAWSGTSASPAAAALTPRIDAAGCPIGRTCRTVMAGNRDLLQALATVFPGAVVARETATVDDGTGDTYRVLLEAYLRDHLLLTLTAQHTPGVAARPTGWGYATSGHAPVTNHAERVIVVRGIAITIELRGSSRPKVTSTLPTTAAQRLAPYAVTGWRYGTECWKGWTCSP